MKPINSKFELPWDEYKRNIEKPFKWREKEKSTKKVKDIKVAYITFNHSNNYITLTFERSFERNGLLVNNTTVRFKGSYVCIKDFLALVERIEKNVGLIKIRMSKILIEDFYIPLDYSLEYVLKDPISINQIKLLNELAPDTSIYSLRQPT